MLAEFEQRLADVLGSRLPSPFTGRVDVAPGPAANTTVRLVLGVQSSELLEADFLAHREVRLPGATPFRRVVKLRCVVGVRANTNRGRREQVPALDAALFALDGPDIRDGTGLADGDDPGFFIERTRLVGSTAALASDGENPAGLSLVAEGWFWPVGAPTQDGEPIVEALVRAGFLPLQLDPAKPSLVAGGEPLELALRLGSVGTMRLRGPGLESESLPFGSLAVTLRDAGARPGAGALSGGAAGADDVRLVPLADGTASITYTPPDAAAVDFLVIAMDDGEGGQGVELGRFRLPVR